MMSQLYNKEESLLISMLNAYKLQLLSGQNEKLEIPIFTFTMMMLTNM